MTLYVISYSTETEWAADTDQLHSVQILHLQHTITVFFQTKSPMPTFSFVSAAKN